jgi:hypothetical protein
MSVTQASKWSARIGASNFFLFRRRPHWKVKQYWTKPEGDAFQQLIHDHKFISIKHYHAANGIDLSTFSIIKTDLANLEQYLLPEFFRLSQLASYYQNLYYWYQWVFVWGAFISTLLGLLATYFAATDATIGNVRWATIFSILTSLVAAVTAYATNLSSHYDPQRRWAKYRRLVEELRIHYFKYLSHLPPYETTTRIHTLRNNVNDVRSRERTNNE